VIKKLFILIICYLLICLYGKSQQPILSVQKFEYIWQPDLRTPLETRVIFASNDSIKQTIEKSFVYALQKRWNVTMPLNSLTVKRLSLFYLGEKPKFNTKIKHKQQDTWYLFLQIFDKGNPALNYNDDSLSATLEVRGKLINGLNDSVIFDRSLSVNFYKDAVPPGEVELTELPAYPEYFEQAFDSVATWLFQSEYVANKSVWLKPACVFIQTKIPAESISELVFKSNEKNIQQLTAPVFSFQLQYPKHIQKHVYKNVAGNAATGAITLFTGVNFDKSKLYEYNADFDFKENDNIYQCILTYFEKQTAHRERETTTGADGSKSHSISSTEYQLDERHITPDSSNIIVLNNDTIASFAIHYSIDANERKKYTRFWDGQDSTTIRMLPKEWNNKAEDRNVTVAGRIEGNSFSMKTSNETAEKDFYINDQLVLIMFGKTVPGKALLFQPLSIQQLKIFTILSSLPYAYFNYTADLQ
jgi:hypothetical protein